MLDPQQLWEELQRSVVRSEDMPTHDSAEGQRVFEALLSGERRRRARRRLIRAIAIALLALALIAAVAIRIAFVSDPISIACFDAANLDANRAVTFTSQPPSVDDCADWWTSGELVNPLWPPGQIPPMIACTAPEGVLWAFPSDDPNTCQSLGLSNPETIPEDHAVLVIQSALGDDYTWEACVPPAQAVLEVRSILDQLDFGDWTVEMMPNLVGECATFSIDSSQTTVLIVPVAPKN